MTDFNLPKAVATKLGWDTATAKHYTQSNRNARIFAHYQDSVNRGRIDPITAVEHCIADLKGSNDRNPNTDREIRI